MEQYVPERAPHEALELMAKLNEIGIQGRDAAYLATVVPPRDQATPEMTSFLREFELMVAPASRSSAAMLIGMPDRAEH
jgi:hypothetical protein